MPVRRKIDRRKAAELPLWSTYFRTGHDFFDALSDAGIVENRLVVPRDLGEEAWHRLGDLFLAEYRAEQAPERHPDVDPPFALAEFGEPSGRRRCR